MYLVPSLRLPLSLITSWKDRIKKMAEMELGDAASRLCPVWLVDGNLKKKNRVLLRVWQILLLKVCNVKIRLAAWGACFIFETQGGGGGGGGAGDGESRIPDKSLTKDKGSY